MSVNETRSHPHGLHVVIPSTTEARTPTPAATTDRADTLPSALDTPGHTHDLLTLPSALDTPGHTHALFTDATRSHPHPAVFTNTTRSHPHPAVFTNATTSHPHPLITIDVGAGVRGPVADGNGSNTGTPGHTHGAFVFPPPAVPRPNARVARRSSLFTADEDRFDTDVRGEDVCESGALLPATSEAEEVGSAELDGAFEKREPGAGKEAHKVEA